MSSPLNEWQVWANGVMAQYGRTNSFNGYRVDYITGSETPLFTEAPLRLDTSGARQSVMNALPGVTYLVVTGMKDILRPGDRLEPTIDDGSSPGATIITNTEMSDCVAVRAGRIGSIEATQRGPTLYSNVYFEYVSIAGVLAPEIVEFTESKRLETNRAVLYARDNVKKGYRLIDTVNGRRYLILAVSGVGENHYLLSIQGDSR